ncbi:uncharacterized protein LOC126999230 isoform X24 [Eriocheir sinensis]|uniref:uncharacterized protein LOC126999230 isoform X24 n=1 Tax=Eriocheir sinensis TaxID=95602 RepID=UPI0021C9A702|nr:uncharacterized protein LOC126999230 isoform X24 [Eriocheir sinensis]XP_050717562.1 uncharacterized protein LOC126999230 isoform X24 [Eriocheir sinensis]
MKFIMNWDQPQGPFRRAYTCHRPRHEGKDDQTSGNSRKRNSSTLACVETGCECMCVSGCLTCCRCPSAGHCQQSNFVSWPVCRLWTLSGEQLGVLAWVQTVDAVKRETSVSWPVCSLASDAVKILWTLSGEQLGALAWEKTGDFVSRATLCPGLCADCGHCQESNWVSWPGCRQWMQSRGKLQCPGLCAAWQVMQLRFCGHSQETSLGILACVEALVSEELREFF